ncbi:hypothetical protein [Polyangium sp. 6x1]|uniref:hypothetical protein n=1 Tax=Polyangium sp. 6x1 TaxID=3042689 RepID=UPI002482663E|nr:hypothetical protein [Polyangium sp. 6x1]MDI1452004.1 hypothetical protein [Polyangium sp. 6x1]
MPRVLRSLFLALSFSLAGCTGAFRGTPLSEVPKPAAVTARATTAEPDGLRVVTATATRIAEEGVWLAADEEELRSLWNAIGAEGPPPRVDFDTHVVLGSSYLGGVCEPEIDTAEVDAAGTLRLRTHPLGHVECILLGVYLAQAIAVPRRILPSRFVFVAPDSGKPYALDLPAAKPRASAASRGAPPISSLERPSLPAPLGVVALPPQGHIALRTLDDGRAVWVVAHRSGAISVLSADEPRSSYSPWLRKKVEWISRVGRFGSEHDAAGRSVHGAAPLETRVFARQGDGRIAIGEPAPLAPGPIEPRAEAPTLQGSSEPYTDLPLLPLDAMPEGRVARVDSDLVFGLSGPARLCNLPTVDKVLDHFPGCPEHAPAVLGSPSEPRRGVTFMQAPVIVRRRGGAVDLAILGSDGTGGLASNPLFPPAPRGDSRARGALTMGAPVRGTTSGAKDGVSPACVPVGGAPDETWTFTAPRAGLYAFQLDSDYDGALAVHDADGALLACNDDRHSLVSSSLVHISLAQGARAKVVVDGFGGHHGAYTLWVKEEAPLAHGGVLVLGREVAGDTSKSTDDHAGHCTSDGNDDEWLFDAEDTTYVFRLETPGWTGVLSVLAEGTSMPHHCTREPSPSSPLVTEWALAPKKYKVIVDGPSEKDAGPYRLRVERKAP